jgi:uncharacterized protein YndB with AHSA1/START domain
MRTAIALAAACCGALPAAGAVSEVSPSGFLVTLRTEVPAKPPAAYATLTSVASWWGDSHTDSGSARNLSLEAAAGGCFCERWEGSSVQHARVLYAMPGAGLRLEGSLGPLQAMAVTGILTVALAPSGEGTAIALTYRVRGAPEAGLDRIAAAVDGMWSGQLDQLARALGAPR